jgi:hypothetical protein
MIPNSIVAMRVFLNIAILHKGGGNDRRRRIAALGTNRGRGQGELFSQDNIFQLVTKANLRRLFLRLKLTQCDKG